MEEERHNRYKDMLLGISQTIESEDLKRMKFRCDQIIKKKQNEKILEPTDLFTALEERGYLGETNVEYLKELLLKCCAGKVDGLLILDTYGQTFVPSYIPQGRQNNVGAHSQIPGFNVQAPVSGAQPNVVYILQNGTVPPTHCAAPRARQRYEGPDLTKQISFLCQSLGRDWKFFIRALGVPEDEIENISLDYRTVRERIHQCLLSWQHQLQQSASQEKLVAALRHSSVQRNDLALKLEEGRF